MNTNKNITAGDNFTLHLGDNLATLKAYPDNTFDSIVTDPPYGIDFLGKEWDSHTGTVELYKECLRVLKPGGYLLAFSAARTYHKLAYSVELAGFEIRDQLMWLYSSGFPKAQDIGKAIDKRAGNVDKDFQPTTLGHIPFNEDLNSVTENRCSKCNKGKAHYLVCEEEVCARKYKIQTDAGKEWKGFKTALKPAHEPIVMARKPFKGSTIDNVLKNGLGAMNIDASRIPWADEADADEVSNAHAGFVKYLGDTGAPTFATAQGTEKKKKSDKPKPQPLNKGLCGPASLTDYAPAAEDAPLSEVSDAGRYPSNVIGEVAEGYQKYFYCPKVSRKERHAGFDNSETIAEMCSSVGGTMESGSQTATLPGIGDIKIHGIKHEVEKIRKAQGITATNVGNNHPTVKPVALMEYLIKLVTPPSTPELQRKVLDPFNGSGSTGMAAVALGHHYTGCELDPKYVEISAKRIESWNTPEPEDNPLPDDLFGE